jgi:hypothetical protein
MPALPPLTAELGGLRRLFRSVDKQAKGLDNRIWAKATDECVIYYLPQLPFLYAYPKPKPVNVQLYSGGEPIEGARY